MEDSMNGECEYTLDDIDTDGTKWYRCTTHDELAPSEDAPCAGYIETSYVTEYGRLIGMVRLRSQIREKIMADLLG